MLDKKLKKFRKLGVMAIGKNTNADTIERLDNLILVITKSLDDDYFVLKDDEFEEVMDRLENLISLRDKLVKEPESKEKFKIDWNQLIGPVISGSLGILSILLIMKYEEDNVITTAAKSIALKFVGR